MFGYSPYSSARTPSAYASPYEQRYLSQRDRAAYLQALQRQRRAHTARASYNPYYGGFYDPMDVEDAEDLYGYPGAAIEREREREEMMRDALAQLYARGRAPAADEREQVNKMRRTAPESQSPRRPTPSPSRASCKARTTIPIHSSPPTQQRQPTASPSSPTSPSPSRPPTPTPTYTDAHIAAANKITSFYRRVQSVRAIRAVEKQFAQLRAEFVPPDVLDYESADGTVTSVRVPASLATRTDDGDDVVPRLAYTAHTRPVHAYADGLVRLLNALDAVPSAGDGLVRGERRAAVRAVEGEAARLEAWWRGVWAGRNIGSEGEEDEGR
ncbi:hypothetical protein FA95DRAFT_1601812 [Auriscalpium vulgare]|uniref:Uncharacterized protein n=1 Tax=Auriscalpium vulgare TaxID=40419 RepID=A0ACB8S8C4_9AGAM|nr:hypothetical protein FA95DRAFT_1601812 [Auriscalpium vulgare]